MSRSNGIHNPETLTDDDWLSVDALAEVCRKRDQLELPLHRAVSRRDQETNHFLYYLDADLIGFVSLPPGDDIEVLGMVHPDDRRGGIGRLLLTAVEAECEKRGVPDYLIVCEVASSSGIAFAEATGASYEFSEHLMELDRTAQGGQRPGTEIELDTAMSADIDDLVGIRIGPGEDVDQARRAIEGWLRSDAHQILVARNGQRPVGMIRVTRMDDTVWLTSFAVLNSLRGKGLGRQILKAVISGLEPERRILLEVETDNDNALALYRSVGFREKTTYRYYRRRIG